MTELPKYKITQFEKALHDRSAFSCGVTPIDNWVKTSITYETKNDRVRLWCGTDPEGTLFGVYALNSHSVAVEEAGPLANKKDRKPIPVLYLTCLAIDVRFQNQGLGEALMGHAVEKAVQLSKEIAISAILLDVFHDEHFDRRLAFYAKLGFSSFDAENPARMYLTMSDARAAVAALEKQKAEAKA
ncbi:GNAT family N-acetyltransferase [Rhodovulum sulfidophilum]|uniref:GNAT family N-acetyltransferase n=1 Tax=Rhodovulum sulfidophilum TaxID=35806 RepID=UPI00192215ED|nr:GNAT family N-acetyltransferase [Rhodovulum sulfidophilum]MBL3554474.1 GNAT family N-acetyltransferase [Rhodovulum sulfidophilum]